MLSKHFYTSSFKDHDDFSECFSHWFLKKIKLDACVYWFLFLNFKPRCNYRGERLMAMSSPRMYVICFFNFSRHVWILWNGVLKLISIYKVKKVKYPNYSIKKHKNTNISLRSHLHLEIHSRDILGVEEKLKQCFRVYIKNYISIGYTCSIVWMLTISHLKSQDL